MNWSGLLSRVGQLRGLIRSDGASDGVTAQYFSWLTIIRLGLVQTALGSIVVLTTSTMNRIMVIELALPAAIPGALVGLHYAIQVLRPRLGYGSDLHGRRTPWIVGGVAVLGTGAVLASLSIWVATQSWAAGLLISIFAFVLIGLGVGAGGTALLTLLATGSSPARRAPAATIVWIMMIVGFILTTAIVGQLLDPYSPARLTAITAWVAGASLLVTALAVWGLEAKGGFRMAANATSPTQLNADSMPASAAPTENFVDALKQVWAEPAARNFAFFVFVSMLAYSAQDLILEPFAGSVFSMTPGESTSLSSLQHGGVLIGMLVVAALAGTTSKSGRGSLWAWTLFGCISSAIALIGLACAAKVGAGWPIRANVFALGVANGAYAVAAIASMMQLVNTGAASRSGLRMGLWGAAQALAFGFGGFLGATASDIGRLVFSSSAYGYGLVFAIEGVLFIVSGVMAMSMARSFKESSSALVSNKDTMVRTPAGIYEVT